MAAPTRPVRAGAGAVVPITSGTTATVSHRAYADPAIAHAIEASARHLAACGPRAIAECVKEVAAFGDVPPHQVAAILDRYRALPASTVHAVLSMAGGRQFPPRPLHQVP